MKKIKKMRFFKYVYINIYVVASLLFSVSFLGFIDMMRMLNGQQTLSHVSQTIDGWTNFLSNHHNVLFLLLITTSSLVYHFYYEIKRVNAEIKYFEYSNFLTEKKKIREWEKIYSVKVNNRSNTNLDKEITRENFANKIKEDNR
jgi:hypothetical protein